MKHFLSIICIAIVLCPIAVGASEPTFIQQINILWKAKDYSQIFQLATAKASGQPPLPEAYAVLYGYHLYITSDLPKAIESLDKLAARIKATHPVGYEGVIELRNDLLQEPNGPPLTPAALNGVHQMLPDEFPVRTILWLISANR